MARPFRFGVQVSHTPDAATWRETARKAEDLGYSTIFMPDHFGAQFAPVPALMAVADATERLRIGTLVFANDYKHPVVLAKETATLDLLSGGRLELGIGAGWMNSDYDQSGIPHDRAGVRIDRLQESVKILQALFGDGPVTFEGEHYTIHGLEGQPKPVQRPHPPLLIGGGGRRVLRYAAEVADIVGVNPSIASGEVDAAAARDGGADVTDEKVAWVRSAAGDRYADIEMNMLIFAVMVDSNREANAAAMAPLFGLEPEGALQYPHAWFGTVDQICEDLVARRERWDVSYLVVQGDAMDAVAPIVARLSGS